MIATAIRSLAKGGLQRLPFNILYEMFYQSGRALGVRSYEVAGNAGNFIGPLSDQSVMKQYLRHGSFSPIIVTLFSNFFKSRGGGIFYDLGANIGLVTVPIAQNSQVQCVSFEPDPGNFALLRANVIQNCQHQNVEVVNAAIAQERGRLRFTRSDYNSGDHRLSEDGLLIVDAVRLDDYTPKAMPLAVKIDCQGAEPSIIAGGLKTLAKADLIACEFWPWGIRRMGLSPEPILDFALQNFQFAQVLQHNQPLGTPLCMKDAIPKLQRLIKNGGEFAQADLVLTRD